MNGYIEYSDVSEISPMYPRSIVIGDRTYQSAHDAILSGEDPLETMLLLVRNNRDVFYPYRNYTFQGMYDTYLNQAINTLFIPKREAIDIGRYVYILDRVDMPIEYSIPILRNVYVIRHIKDNVYVQDRVLDIVELYNVFLIQDTPLYVGTNGTFILLDTADQDVVPILLALGR